MIGSRPDLGEILESFFLGLSCLIGSEQFYFAYSELEGPLRNQYFVLIPLALVTLIMILAFLNQESLELKNFFHLYYTFLVVLLYFAVRQKVKSELAYFVLSSFIGHVLPLCIIFCCVQYSSSRYLVLTFLLGLFAARFLPSLCWIMIKNPMGDYRSQLREVALILSLARIVASSVSILINISMGRLTVHVFQSVESSKDDNGSVFSAFGKLKKTCYGKWSERMSVLGTKNEPIKFLSILNFIFSPITPVIFFLLSLILFLTFSPMMHTSMMHNWHVQYSNHLVSSVSQIEIIFHLAGSCFGIAFPASVTANPDRFYYITGFCYGVYLISTTMIIYFGRKFSTSAVNIIIMVSSFVLGYLWSYTLGIVYNITIGKTCIYDEFITYACCGDKINRKCYCKYPSVVNDVIKCDYSKRIDYSCNFLGFMIACSKDKKLMCLGIFVKINNRFFCSSSSQIEFNSLEYRRTGLNAVIILANGCSFSDCSKNHSSSCDCSSSTGKTICCLRLVGVYKLDAVTTTNCDDCQLTVRLEAKCCCTCDNSGTGSNENCSCFSNEKISKSCCICLGCKSSTSNNCCCIKFCAKDQCTKLLSEGASTGTRVFLCYKDNGNCCIREIEPNTTPEFDKDLQTQNQFYVKNIFISDCCHSDLHIDLHCFMKNNFFRPPINYRDKLKDPKKLALAKRDLASCKSDDQGCKRVSLMKVCVSYDDDKDKMLDKCAKCQPDDTCCQKEGKACTCCSSGKCCCCSICKLDVSPKSLYDKEIEPVKVKMVTILWIIFLLTFMLSYTIVSNIKVRRIKHYGFKPLISFKDLQKRLKKYDFNSEQLIDYRLKYVDTFKKEERMALYKEKLNQRDEMVELFKNTFEYEEYLTLKRYVEQRSENHFERPKFQYKNWGKELVEWSYYLGFMYSYVVTMFFSIQRFFVEWEYVWQREYFNHLDLMTSKLGSILMKSKFANSLFSELRKEQVTQIYIKKERLASWNETYNELEDDIQLYEKEKLFFGIALPSHMSDRIDHYLNRWEHRHDRIIKWEAEKSSTLEWRMFIEEYPNIKTWLTYYSTYVKMAFERNVIESKKMNKGIGVFIRYNIK